MKPTRGEVGQLAKETQSEHKGVEKKQSKGVKKRRALGTKWANSWMHYTGVWKVFLLRCNDPVG